MTAKLSVNLNAVAMLRNRRNLPWPSVTGLGLQALEAGAAGLTVHPRPDERHIRGDDCFDLIKVARAHRRAEFNMEGFPDARFMGLCEAIRPDQVTLVPDDPSQPTSDHGWAIGEEADMLRGVIQRLTASGMRVSLFIDADPEVPKRAAAVGAARVELYTGPYGHTFEEVAKAAELDKLAATAEAAREAGLGINAGHDLTLDNLPPFVARVPFLDEVSIGHAFTADCLTYGMAETVRLYNHALGG